jgi:hypothetical protein
MNFLGNPFLHVSHGLVVIILACGAGGPGSIPGRVPCGIEEERLWKLWVMDDVTKVCDKVRISLIICSQKCNLNLLKFQKIFVEI